jgi:hypothetical protein
MPSISCWRTEARSLASMAMGGPAPRSCPRCLGPSLLVRQKALRRLPVVENDHAIGIVSLGDLTQNRDPDPALGEISAAPPYR